MKNKKITVYISGKITGENHEECTRKFAVAESRIRKLGFNVINPLNIKGNTEITPWKIAMQNCLNKLPEAHILFMLRDWQQSIGARHELQHWTFDMKRQKGTFLLEEMDGYQSLEYIKKQQHTLGVIEL